jgi:hypothetical protein
MFIGGHWLLANGAVEGDEAEARRWAKLGRYWLENRSSRLIAGDGSFSQHSVNYHRLMLDAMSLAELWRQRLTAPAFSERHIGAVRAAVMWLYTLTDPVTGDVPNLGANDGARLLPLTATGYRDFRPAVQLGAALFAGASAYPDDPGANEVLDWLELARPAGRLAPVASQLFDDGGYALLVAGRARVLVRYPRFRFRPAQADALHVDLWLGSDNVLRDAGSYSYNAELQWQNYFPGTAAHNTVQFDGRDQMPRVSRFLFAEWLRTRMRTAIEERDGRQAFSVAYTDSAGASHERSLELANDCLHVADSVSGFSSFAVLRWRLMPGRWEVQGNTVCGPGVRLIVSADVPIERLEIVAGWESRFYAQKNELPVLEVEVARQAKIITEVNWIS